MYCHDNFLECNLMISFGKKVVKNDDLRWEMPFCLQISLVNILQSEADKDLKYFIIGTRNLQSQIWIFHKNDSFFQLLIQKLNESLSFFSILFIVNDLVTKS